MLHLEKVYKKFSNEEILKGITINVKPGEIICLIGPSGSGKTTLLRCINFLERPDSGKITIGSLSTNYQNINNKTISQIRTKSAMVFQNYNLFHNKTAIENIMEGLIYAKKTPKQEAYQIAKKLLKKVGLEHKKNAYPNQLSGGQKQRIGIARAMAMTPDVLLLDEPTSALDPEIIGDILELIKEIAHEGQTMIIVTHEMSFAYEVATRVIFMERGQIIEEGTPKTLFVTPTQERTKTFLERINFHNYA